MSSEISTKKERFKITPAVYLILIKDNQILLSRRFNTGYEDGNYSLPSGHKESGEYPSESVSREAKEEIGITIDPKDLVCVHTMMRTRDTDSERVDQFFVAKKYDGVPINCEPEKCDDLSWFPLTFLPNNIISYVRQAVLNYLDGVSYSEFGK